MQTCLWTQRIWIYNHLISISKYTHQISTSLILIFSFSDWNNGWNIPSKKQTIILFGFLTWRVCSSCLKVKCKNLFSALRIKVQSIFVHGFTLVELMAVTFYFVQTFCSAFCTQPTLFKLNPVCIISGLQEHDPAPSRSIFIPLWWAIEQDFCRLNGRVKSWLTQFWDWTQHLVMWLEVYKTDSQSWEKVKWKNSSFQVQTKSFLHRKPLLFHCIY